MREEIIDETEKENIVQETNILLNSNTTYNCWTKGSKQGSQNKWEFLWFYIWNTDLIEKLEKMFQC